MLFLRRFRNSVGWPELSAALVYLVAFGLIGASGSPSSAITVDVDAAISGGNYIQIFPNDQERNQPVRVPLIDSRKIYHFAGLPDHLTRLRVDPTNIPGATIQIFGIKVLRGGHTLVSITPTALQHWTLYNGTPEPSGAGMFRFQSTTEYPVIYSDLHFPRPLPDWTWWAVAFLPLLGAFSIGRRFVRYALVPRIGYAIMFVKALLRRVWSFLGWPEAIASVFYWGIFGIVAFSRLSGPVVVDVDAAVSDGDYIQVFPNDQEKNPPVRLPLIAGTRHTYHFTELPDQLTRLRVDPTNVPNATVQVFSVEIFRGSHTLARIQPGALRHWTLFNGISLPVSSTAFAFRSTTKFPVFYSDLSTGRDGLEWTWWVVTFLPYLAAFIIGRQSLSRRFLLRKPTHISPPRSMATHEGSASIPNQVGPPQVPAASTSILITAAFISALLAALAGLVYWAPAPKEPDFLTLAIDMKATTGSAMNLYVNGNSMGPFRRELVRSERQVYSFNLPEHLTTLRIDPTDQAGDRVSIYSVELLYGGIPVVSFGPAELRQWSGWAIAEKTSDNDAFRFVSTSAAPILASTVSYSAPEPGPWTWLRFWKGPGLFLLLIALAFGCYRLAALLATRDGGWKPLDTRKLTPVPQLYWIVGAIVIVTIAAWTRTQFWILYGGLEPSYLDFSRPIPFGSATTFFVSAGTQLYTHALKDYHYIQYPIGYPALLAAFQYLGLHDPQLWRLGQGLLQSLAVIPLLYIAFTLTGRYSLAITAGAIYALSPYYAHMSVNLLPDTLLPVLYIASLAALLRASRGTTLRRWFLAGVCLGCAFLIRYEVLVAIALCCGVVWLFTNREGPLRSFRRHAIPLVFLAGAMIPLIAWAAHNRIAGGKWRLSNSNSTPYALWCGLGQLPNRCGYVVSDSNAIEQLQTAGLWKAGDDFYSPTPTVAAFFMQKYLSAWHQDPRFVVRCALYRASEIIGGDRGWHRDIASILEPVFSGWIGFFLWIAAIGRLIWLRRFWIAALISWPLICAVATFSWLYVEMRYVRYVPLTYILSAIIVLRIPLRPIERLAPRQFRRALIALVLCSASAYVSIQLYTLKQEADAVAFKHKPPIPDVTYKALTIGPADWGKELIGASPCSTFVN